MAVQDEDSYKRYVANGIATVYAIPFLLLSASDLKVTLNAVPVTAGFTVSGIGTNAGSITFTAAPTGDLLLQRVVPFARLTDYQDNGDLLAKTVNLDFDRLWLAMQELRRDDRRALSASPLEPEGIPALPIVAQRSGRVLAFDLLGNPVPSNLTLEQLEQQPTVAAAAAADASAAASASSAANSAASAAASAASAAAADTAKSKAQKWADEAEDVAVEPGKFSAKHWAAKVMAALSSLTSRVTTVESKVATIEAGMPQKTELLWSGTVSSTGVALGLARPLVAGDIVWLQHSDGTKANSAPQVITSELLAGGRPLGFTFGQSGWTWMTITNASRFTTSGFTAGFGVEKIFASKAGF